MARKDELRKTINAAHIELSAIHEQEAQERNKRSVGKCFKDTEGRAEYVKVLGIEGHILQVWRFQTYKFGRIEIEPISTLAFDETGGDYVEVAEAEFNSAWQGIMEKLERL